MSERLVIHNLSRVKRTDPVVIDHLRRYEYVTSRLPSFARVLDVGCGTGYGAAIMSEKAKRILAVDSSPVAIRDCRNVFADPSIEFRLCDILCDCLWQNIEPHSFDAVTCFEVIEHLPHGWSLTLDRLWRAVSMIGRAYVSIPVNHPDTRWHKRRFTRDEILRMLRRRFTIYREPDDEYPGYELIPKPLEGGG